MSSFFRFCLLFTAAGAFLPGQLLAQEPLSLQQAVQIGLQNNYAIQIASREVTITENNVTLGNAGFLPVVAARASRNNRREDTQQLFLSGLTQERDNAQSQSFNSAIDLNWVIFDGLGMFINQQRLQTFRKAGILFSKATVENTISQITNAYFDVVRQAQKIASIQEAIQISEERIELTQAQYEVGVSAKIAIQTARVDYNADRSELLRQQENLRNAKITLNEVLGRHPDDNFVPTDTIVLAQTFASGSLENLSLGLNPQLQQSKLQQELAYLDLREIRSRRFPVIGLTSSYVFTLSESQAGFVLQNRSLGFNYGFTVGLNIFNGFDNRRLMQNARIQVQNNELAYRQLENTLQSGLARSWSRYQNRMEILELEQANLLLARQNTDIALERYKLGLLTALELREAQRAQLLAQNRLIDILYEAKEAETELRRLTGNLVQENQ
ncbi:TolC family protein [soil metagenome]